MRPLIEISSQLEFHDPAPVRVHLPDNLHVPAGSLQLRRADGRVFPAQRLGNELTAMLEGVPAWHAEQYAVEPAADAGGVQLKDEGPHAIAIVLPDGPFTTFSYDPVVAHPFFYPVLTPGGKLLTRNFPMKKDVPGESHDHPHHRSFWTAYGDVNGKDVWSEDPKHGWVKIQRIENRVQGPTYGGFTAVGVWSGPDDAPLLDSRCTIKVYNAGPHRRLLDYDVELLATYGDVAWGDTKEGGLISLRLADSMTEKKGGVMVNDHGDSGMKAVWGKPAQWVDYSGNIGGETWGVALMDHPGNPNYPCRWHSRDYGLIGTNPFARGAFEGAKTPTPPYQQKKGDMLRFRYRMLIHPGNAKEGKVDEAYHAWIMGPAGKAAS